MRVCVCVCVCECCSVGTGVHADAQFERVCRSVPDDEALNLVEQM